jgi:hypothetical protein
VKVGRDGRVTVRARIEEVSKNHQKQAFCFKLTPDAIFSPANYDISADISAPRDTSTRFLPLSRAWNIV